MICNDLSDRDRTGILRRNGPVIEINEEALVRCEERVWYRKKSQYKFKGFLVNWVHSRELPVQPVQVVRVTEFDGE